MRTLGNTTHGGAPQKLPCAHLLTSLIGNHFPNFCSQDLVFRVEPMLFKKLYRNRKEPARHAGGVASLRWVFGRAKFLIPSTPDSGQEGKSACSRSAPGVRSWKCKLSMSRDKDPVRCFIYRQLNALWKEKLEVKAFLRVALLQH